MLDEARSGAALFDVIVIVDWSAQSSAKRGADSIWSYELDAALPAHGDPINHPTRAEAAFEAAVAEIAHITAHLLADLPPRKQPPPTLPPLRRIALARPPDAHRGS